MRDCPERSLPGFLILKGRLLLRTATLREDTIRAAWCFMRVVIHLPDDPLVPEALVEAAGALRRLERADQAASLLNECLAHARIGDEARKQAEAMLAEVRRNPSAKP
jgi:TolA-binding protein